VNLLKANDKKKEYEIEAGASTAYSGINWE
jgi:hypothetical protein